MSNEIWVALIGVGGTVIVSVLAQVFNLLVTTRTEKLRREGEHELEVMRSERKVAERRFAEQVIQDEEKRRAEETAAKRARKRIAAVVRVDVALETVVNANSGTPTTDAPGGAQELVRAVAALRPLDAVLAASATELWRFALAAYRADRASVVSSPGYLREVCGGKLESWREMAYGYVDLYQVAADSVRSPNVVGPPSQSGTE